MWHAVDSYPTKPPILGENRFYSSKIETEKTHRFTPLTLTINLIDETKYYWHITQLNSYIKDINNSVTTSFPYG